MVPGILPLCLMIRLLTALQRQTFKAAMKLKTGFLEDKANEIFVQATKLPSPHDLLLADSFDHIQICYGLTLVPRFVKNRMVTSKLMTIMPKNVVIKSMIKFLLL